jgi:hypothetical protein
MLHRRPNSAWLATSNSSSAMLMILAMVENLRRGYIILAETISWIVLRHDA